MIRWRRARDWLACHENRVLLYTLASGVAAVTACLIVMWSEKHDPKVRWTVTLLVTLPWLAFAFSARERVISPLRTLANLLEAMREGDYSIRGRGASADDALGEVMIQVNAIGATLRAQRLGAVEATALLRKVMQEIDVAVFTFDSGERLRLVNRAGERLMSQPADKLLDQTARVLGLHEFLVGDETQQAVTRSFPGGAGRWSVSRSNFREGGLPLTMLVLSDLTRALREEELLAWQRIVRVLGHELNNSLTPIKSIAGSLASIVQRTPLPDDWQEDMTRGLAVIATRSESLSRFMGAYARLAKLPRPRLGSVDLGALVRRTAGLETRMTVEIKPGPEVYIQADGDQLEQVMINLIRNAADASAETRGRVAVDWGSEGANAMVRVRDEGLGLSNTANLFVPFFTTKPGGSGIGLVLSRQIVEAHGGSLALMNRQDARGCEARLLLPL
jgi:two-component system, NtrC family, nitrogen regulation sensor histidine kinase NtrY